MSLKISKCLSSIAAPESLCLLKAPLVRERQPIIPTQITESVNKYLKELNYKERGTLKHIASKTHSPTLWTKPPLPRKQEVYRYKKDLSKLSEIIEEEDQKRKRNIQTLSDVDFIMLRNMAPLYFISNRMFSELNTLHPGYQPFSMLDMGHNLGCSVWAANQFYTDYIFDYVIHEHNKSEYNRTVRLLNQKYEPHIPNVVVKGATSLPKSRSASFNIITAINYFPSIQHFQVKDMLMRLWDLTEDYLIVADISNRYTAQRMSFIRTLFVKHIMKELGEGSILAPCPHAGKCPMLRSRDSNVCRFQMANIAAMQTGGFTVPNNHMKIDYTYLILKRGVVEDANDYARLLTTKTIKKKGNMIEAVTCNSDGTMWNSRINKGDQGCGTNPLYIHMRNKKAGDLVDQDWWNWEFQPLSVPWRTQTIEEKTRHLKRKNKDTKNRYERKEFETIYQRLKNQDNVSIGELSNQFEDERSNEFDEQKPSNPSEDNPFEEEYSVLDHEEIVSTIDKF